MRTNDVSTVTTADFTIVDLWLRRWMAMLVIFGAGLALLTWGVNILQTTVLRCPVLQSPCLLAPLWHELGSLIGGALLGGSLVALLAWFALRQYLTHTSFTSWFAANSLAFVTGVLLLRQFNLFLPEQSLVWMSISSMLCGAWIGCIQWWFLRRTLTQAFGWIIVTSTAWSALMLVVMGISLGLD